MLGIVNKPADLALQVQDILVEFFFLTEMREMPL